MTPEETRVYLKERNEKKAKELQSEKEKIMKEFESDEASLAPGIEEKDAEFLATTRVKLSQKDILKMYVGNW